MRTIQTATIITATVLLLSACKAPLAVLGESWQVVNVGGMQLDTSSDMRHYPMFRFIGDSMRVMGFTGCNQFSGPYYLRGDSLRIGPLATTRMACPKMDLESRILSALDQTRRARQSSDTLHLMKGDTVLAILRAYDQPKPPTP